MSSLLNDCDLGDASLLMMNPYLMNYLLFSYDTHLIELVEQPQFPTTIEFVSFKSTFLFHVEIGVLKGF